MDCRPAQQLMRFVILVALLTGCAETLPEKPFAPCPTEGRQDALSTCLKPNQTAEYYIAQAHKYFDTLDGSAPVDSIPNYSIMVARYEWEPWLKLTGIGRGMLVGSDIAVTRLATPSTVPDRDCRFFEQNPFARCRVRIKYEPGYCPIYEEFSFNDAGEMTFIEAWSDQTDLLPTPDASDPWAEGIDVLRMSDRVPGLGNADGLIDLDAPWMNKIVAKDKYVADFVMRAKNFWLTWFQELSEEEGLTEEEIYGFGCGWN